MANQSDHGEGLCSLSLLMAAGSLFAVFLLLMLVFVFIKIEVDLRDIRDELGNRTASAPPPHE